MPVDLPALERLAPRAFVLGGAPVSKARLTRLGKALGVVLPVDYRALVTAVGCVAVSMDSDRYWTAVAESPDAPSWATRLRYLHMLAVDAEPDDERSLERVAARLRMITGTTHVPLLELGGSVVGPPEQAEYVCASQAGAILAWSSGPGGWTELDGTFTEVLLRLVREQAQRAEEVAAWSVGVLDREAFLAALELVGEAAAGDGGRFDPGRLPLDEAVAVYAGISERDAGGALDWHRAASTALGLFVSNWAYGLRGPDLQAMKRYVPLLARSRANEAIEQARARAVEAWCEDTLLPRWTAFVRAKVPETDPDQLVEASLALEQEMPLEFFSYASKIAREEFGAAAGFTARSDTADLQRACEVFARRIAREVFLEARARLAPERRHEQFSRLSELGLRLDDLRARLHVEFAPVVAEVQASAHAFLARQLPGEPPASG